MVKECVRAMQNEEGVLVIDDSSVEKLYTDENELNCWHYTLPCSLTVYAAAYLSAMWSTGNSCGEWFVKRGE